MQSDRSLHDDVGPFVRALLRPYRARIGLFLIASLAASIFDGMSAGLLVPLFVSLQSSETTASLPGALHRLADLFAGLPHRERILVSLAAVVTAVLLKNVLLAVSTYLAATLSTRITLDLRKRGIDLLMRVRLDFLHRFQPGDLVERLLAHTSRIEFLIVQVTDFVVNLASCAALFVVLVVLSWQLTVLSAIAAAAILGVLTLYVRFLGRAGSRAERRSRDLAASLHDVIAGMPMIRAAVRERPFTRRLTDHADGYAEANQHIIIGNYLAHILTESLGIVALAAICIAALGIVGGQREVVLVQLVPFVYVLTRILPAVKELNRSRAQIASRWPFALRIHDLLRPDDKPFAESGTRPFTGLARGIRFDHVSFAWHDAERWALDDVSFEIPAGRTTAILGPSGAGKSSVIALILRFYDPQRGTVFVDDVPVWTLDPASYRGRIALVAQDEFIFHDTLAANVVFGATEVSDESFAAAARLSGVDAIARQLPDGYETVVGHRGVTLSGGQRQRIALARAVLRQPNILILDEATSALDIEAETSIRAALDATFPDCTRIVIAHRPSAVAGADHIVTLDSGRVVPGETIGGITRVSHSLPTGE